MLNNRRRWCWALVDTQTFVLWKALRTAHSTWKKSVIPLAPLGPTPSRYGDGIFHSSHGPPIAQHVNLYDTYYYYYCLLDSIIAATWRKLVFVLYVPFFARHVGRAYYIAVSVRVYNTLSIWATQVLHSLIVSIDLTRSMQQGSRCCVV